MYIKSSGGDSAPVSWHLNFLGCTSWQGCVGKPNCCNAGLSFFTSDGIITVKIMSDGGDLHRKAVIKPCRKSGVSYFPTVVIYIFFSEVEDGDAMPAQCTDPSWPQTPYIFTHLTRYPRRIRPFTVVVLIIADS